MTTKSGKPKFFVITILRCLKNALINTINHDGIEHAGYLAFLGLLALFPFLVFLFSVIGVMGQGEAGAIFISEVLAKLPNDVTAALQPRIFEIISGPPQGLLTISILGAIWTASSAVEGIRTVLNRAYHVSTPPAYWFRRGLSILQLLFFTSLVIAGMMLVVFIPLLLHYIEVWVGIYFVSDYELYWSRVFYLVSIGTLFLAVGYIYYVIPNIKQSIVAVAPGAAVVAVCWIGAAYLLSVYLSYFEQVNLIYGSLGGIIAALIFFYICNVIFIFGAELNYLIMHALGLRVTATNNAVPTLEEK
jgi:membrane protein